MLSPTTGSVKHGLTLDAGLREAVEEGFLAVEVGLVVPTLEGGLEPALREAGLEDVPSTAFEAGFAFEAGLVALDAGLIALEAGLVAFEAGLVALEAGLVLWETTSVEDPERMSSDTRTFFAGGSSSSASSAFLFLPRDLGGAAVSSPAGCSSFSSALDFLERGLAGAFLGAAGSGSDFGWSLMRAERRGATSASAAAEVDLGLATMIIDDESRGKKRRLGFCCSCERVVDLRTRDDVDRVSFRSPPESPASPP
jgi:hypothetical protein